MKEGKSPLPIDSQVPHFLKLLREHHNLVVVATPGSGKTTRLPPALLGAVNGQILVLEPRRMAAVAAAHRIAQENGWRVGEEVGYQVRFDSKASNKTRLIFMTEALLARRLLEDGELKGVGAVVLDEFHERSLHVDLALGLLRELQELGAKLKIIVMSATLEAASIQKYLEDAPLLEAPGALFELQVIHSSTPLKPQIDRSFFEKWRSTMRAAWQEGPGDVLAFLPGVGEIERARRELEMESWARDAEIQILHGSLALEEQQKVLKASPRRRIILSTNVAESSVTVDGLRAVVDCGLAKVMRFEPRSGFSRLELSRISLASARQRAGRAARQATGRCYRLWSAHEETTMEERETPEVQRLDLSETLLTLSAMGVRDFRAFPWFEFPSPEGLKRAETFLRNLGALEKDNQLSALGKKLIALPIAPRLGRLILYAAEKGLPSLGAELAALLQERDIMKAEALDSLKGDGLECDLSSRWQILKDRSGSRREIYFERLQTVTKSAEQLRRLIGGKDQRPAQVEDIPALLFEAYKDRLCRRRGQSNRGLMVGGRGVILSEESSLRTSEFFLSLEGLDSPGKPDSTIRLACGLDKADVLKWAEPWIQTREEVIYIDEKKQFFTARGRSAFGLSLEEPSLTPATAESVADQLPQLMLKQLEDLRRHNEAFDSWWQRWSAFHKWREEDEASALSEERLKQACESACYNEKSLKALESKDLTFHFESVFSPEILREFHKELPLKLQVPSGSWIPVHYPQGQAPFIEVRLQELFGLREFPKLFHGRIPLTVHLLGPNFRPVQVTADLPSFWKNGYPEVRKELRSRYPKHSWPEDPLTAKPEAKGKRRS